MESRARLHSALGFVGDLLPKDGDRRFGTFESR
jgi:hypothetical protein